VPTNQQLESGDIALEHPRDNRVVIIARAHGRTLTAQK
jgi:hypothetical protein